jgi:hypothetical protein
VKHLKKVDLAIAVAMILTALQAFNAWSYRSIPLGPLANVNSKLEIPSVSWNSSPRSIVLAFTTSCHFCQKSGEFYAELSRAVADQANVRFIVVAPEEDRIIRDWMNGHGISKFEHVRQNFMLHGFKLTPSIAIVDGEGVVTDLALGFLSRSEEKQVLDRVVGQGDRFSIRAELHRTETDWFENYGSDYLGSEMSDLWCRHFLKGVGLTYGMRFVRSGEIARLQLLLS